MRVGRYGPYVQVGEQRASLPEDLAPDELTVDRAVELANAPSGDRVLGVDPTTGHDVVAKAGRYGPYVSVVPPEGSAQSEQAADGLAVRLHVAGHDHPRAGAHAAHAAAHPRRGRRRAGDGAERPLRAVRLPRQGVAHARDRGGSCSRSRWRRRCTCSRSPSSTAGARPPRSRRSRRSARTRRQRRRRWSSRRAASGPYVTDGETNASLRKGDTPEGLTDERASELLAERRARGPAAKKTAARKAPAKKAAAKKAPAKKAAPRRPRPRRRRRRRPRRSSGRPRRSATAVRPGPATVG